MNLLIVDVIIPQIFNTTGRVSDDLNPKHIQPPLPANLIDIMNIPGNEMEGVPGPKGAVSIRKQIKGRIEICSVGAFIGCVHIDRTSLNKRTAVANKRGADSKNIFGLKVNRIGNINGFNFTRHLRQICKLVINDRVIANPFARGVVDILKLKVGRVLNLELPSNFPSLPKSRERGNKGRYYQEFVWVFVPTFTVSVVIFCVVVFLCWAGYELIRQGLDNFSRRVDRGSKRVSFIWHLIAGLGLIIGGLELMEHTILA